jgi:hypothetical protein
VGAGILQPCELAARLEWDSISFALSEWFSLVQKYFFILMAYL